MYYSLGLVDGSVVGETKSPSGGYVVGGTAKSHLLEEGTVLYVGGDGSDGPKTVEFIDLGVGGAVKTASARTW